MRDPITEWEDAIKSRLGHWALVLIMLAFVMCLVAPIFGPAIKQVLRQQYVMEKNYEELATKAMGPVWILLWTICGVAWGIVWYIHNYHRY